MTKQNVWTSCGSTRKMSGECVVLSPKRVKHLVVETVWWMLFASFCATAILLGIVALLDILVLLESIGILIALTTVGSALMIFAGIVGIKLYERVINAED